MKGFVVLFNNQKWRVISINNREGFLNCICMDDTLSYPPIKNLKLEQVEILSK